jgi:uncharacterized membrane protein
MTILFNTRTVSDSPAHDYMRGVSAIFNVSGRTHREYRFSKTDDAADCAALLADWEAIGGDLNEAVTQYRRSGNNQ